MVKVTDNALAVALYKRIFTIKCDINVLLLFTRLADRDNDSEVCNNNLYHTKSILTNQIAIFEGDNGSYIPPCQNSCPRKPTDQSDSRYPRVTFSRHAVHCS